jgi:hypothetical protein
MEMFGHTIVFLTQADYRELRLDLPTDHSDKSNRKITKKK